MKKAICKSYLLTALMVILIACLTGATVMLASAQEEQTTVVTFTSSTTVMKVDEEFEFAAQVTLEDGTISTDVEWSSSNEDVIFFEEAGLALAVSEGTATITATAEDGAYASVDVYVSESAIHVESIELYPNVLELGVGWKTRIGYTVIPDNATDQRVTWTSSNPSVITVDENGNVEALADGDAVITATAYDSGIVATCAVVVNADLGEATLTPNTLVTMIGQVENNVMTVSLPEGVSAEGADYQWYSMDDSIASVDLNDDDTGSIFSWNFGTTTIYVVVTVGEDKYAAMGTVHVTADFYYLTGLEEDLADPTENPWLTYDTEEEAEAAGVLLVPSETNPYVFSITREFWAFDNFQIIHNNMDTNWTTKITPASYVTEGSSTQYVANDADTFAVNALGEYTVTLNLSDGRAQVTIEMVDLVVTEMTVSVAEGSAAYLQYEGPEGAEDPAAARTMLLDVATLPAGATYELTDVEITIPENLQEYVSAEAIQNEQGNLQIRLTMLKNYTEPTDLFTLGIKLENATADVNITILADGEAFVPVTEVTFESAPYILNVNNDAKAWNTPINAVVNSDASVKDVVYTSSDSHLWFEYIDGQAYAHVDALGTYTIKATSLSNPDVSDETTVLATSLVVPEEGDMTSGFYLIGRLDGVEVENWTSIVPEKTDFTDSAFAGYVLNVVEGSDYKLYTGTFNLRARDVFSIAFLGMNGSWDGIINNEYMDWDTSVGTYWANGINVEMSENGQYAVTLNLSGNVPSFIVERVGDYNPAEEYDLWLYIVASGDSWNGDLSDEGNVIAQVGYIHMVDGVAQSMTLTIDAVNFYEFYTKTGEWPTIQFVTAHGGTNGIEGGYFQNATWYGSSSTGITFDGDAYIAPEEVEEGDTNYFTNSESRSELYWVGDITADVNMTVSFTFTFDETGAITAVELNFVTSSEVLAE